MVARLWLLAVAFILIACWPSTTAEISNETKTFLTDLRYTGSTANTSVCSTEGAANGLGCNASGTLISVDMRNWTSCAEGVPLPTIPTGITKFIASGCAFMASSIRLANPITLAYLDVANANITGTIPIASTLTFLNLAQNNISGSIPPNLTSLTSLDLSWEGEPQSCFNSASVPNSLTLLTNLNLANRLIYGSIPPELTKLVTVNLLNTAVGGTIPSNLTSLVSLNISGTAITGSIPKALTKLTTLYVTNSGWSGDLCWLADVPSLTTLVASNSRFAWNASCVFKRTNWVRLELANNPSISPLPSNYNFGSNLLALDLSATYLTGTITFSHFNSTSKLETLRLQLNPDLAGQLNFIRACTSLVELRIGPSPMGGSIPLNSSKLANVSVVSTQATILTVFSIAEGADINVYNNRISTAFIATTGIANLNLSRNALKLIELNATLSSLKQLDLSNNLLESVPGDLFKSDIPLVFLNISSNLLSDGVPSALPHHLVHLDLSNNSLSGAIDSESWGSMETINLQMNWLSGTVSSLVKFSNLSTLQLQCNELSGTLAVPPRNLVTLKAQNNHFIEIKAALEASDPLAVLDVSNNSLYGPLPLLPSNLTVVRMQDNLFEGPLTLSADTPLPFLQELRLSNNSLSGPITWPVNSTPNLRELHLDNNEFSSITEDGLLNSGLLQIDLSYNQLTGTLPNLPAFIQHINMASNQFTGNLPTSWYTPQLKSINLARNRLDGALWNSLFQPPLRLNRINLAFNNFSGTIVQKLNPYQDDPPLYNYPSLVNFRNNALSRELPPWFANVTSINVANNGFATGIPDLTNVVSFIAYNNRLNLCAGIPSAPLLENCNLANQTVCSDKCATNYTSLNCPTAATFPDVVCAPCTTVQPSDQFFCEFEKWVSIQVNTTGTVITGGGVTVIEGNMTVTNGSIVVISNSSLSVQGCSDLTGNATLVITESDIENWTRNASSGSKTILTSAKGWCSSTPLLSLGVTGPASKDPCKSITYRTESTSTSVVVYFNVSNRCFKWWPIVIGVSSGIVVIAILLGIFFRLNRTAAQLIWPYMKQDENLPEFEVLEEEEEMRSFLTEPLLTGAESEVEVDLRD